MGFPQLGFIERKLDAILDRAVQIPPVSRARSIRTGSTAPCVDFKRETTNIAGAMPPPGRLFTFCRAVGAGCSGGLPGMECGDGHNDRIGDLQHLCARTAGF